MSHMKVSRTHFAKGRPHSEDESVKIDYSKSPHEILKEILVALNHTELPNSKKLSYCNAFVKFFYREGFHVETIFTKQEVLICLRSGLFSKLKELRTATLRCIRYFCTDVEVVRSFFGLHLHYLVIRSLDISFNVEAERTNALRLIRRIMFIALPPPSSFKCSSSSSSSSPLTTPPLQVTSPVPPPTETQWPSFPTPSAAASPTFPLPSNRIVSNGYPISLASPALCTSFVSLLNGVVAIANEGFVNKDKLFNVCLSTVCEMVTLEPFLAAQVGGISCLLRNVPQFHGHPRINEALVVAILNVFNFPNTRPLIRMNLDLEQMLVPFTDLEYQINMELKDRYDCGLDMKYGACKLALGTILRSWSGIFYLCNRSSQGLKSLFSMLSISDMETRKEILDVFYDIFRFSVPEWTDNFNVALESITALSKTMDPWKLVNGFVAEEGKSVLPHLSVSRLYLNDNHMSFVLCCFVDHGILEAVTQAIISSDKHVCVRATVLFGELLHLMSMLLPESYNRDNHCLPRLIDCVMSSTNTNPSLRIQCSDALDCLLKIQNSKRIPATEYASHFLQQQILSCRNAATLHLTSTSNDGWVNVVSNPSDWSQWSTYQARVKKDSSSEREYSDSLPQLLKDSQVLYTTDSKSWKWFSVLTILKYPESSLEIAVEHMGQRFLERLIQVFKPSSRIYSAMKLSDEKCQEMTLIAFHLVDYLLNSPEQMARTLLFSFLKDINGHLLKLIEKSNITESLMNPSYLISCCSQMYFLLIGRLSSSRKGNQLLGSSKIYDSFSLIASSATSTDIIIKLMVSSLDYSCSVEARKILKEALMSASEKSSQYCTSFLRILLRCRFPLFTEWCIPLLIGQLKSKSMAVATEALSVLMEAAEDEEHLRFMAIHRHNLHHLGFKSDSLISCFLSLPDLFQQMRNEGVLEREMDKWRRCNNVEFVNVIEERLVESMTTFERTYNYNYSRRTSRKYVRKDVLVPIHLYGQLVRHEQGVEYLKSQAYLDEYFETVRRAGSCSKEALKSTKSALWVMGHIGSTDMGMKILLERDILKDVVQVAQMNPTLTLRGTAFYVLGMLSVTRVGCKELKKFGWSSVRNDKVDPYFAEVAQKRFDATSCVQHQKGTLYSNVSFMPEIVERPIDASQNDVDKSLRRQDSSGAPVTPVASSVTGDRLAVEERRGSILESLLKKFKSKSHKTSSGNVAKNSNPEKELNGPHRTSQGSSASEPQDEVTDERRRSSDAATSVKKFPSGKPQHSVHSSCSSTGKMSTSVGSDECHFSSGSVFMFAHDSDEKVDKKLDGRPNQPRKLPGGAELTVTCGSSSPHKNVSGFLSDPDILRPTQATPRPQFVWSTVGDVVERHKKTKSLDYRALQKGVKFRHSIKDRIKSIRGTGKFYGDTDSRHLFGRSPTCDGASKSSLLCNHLQLQRMPSHFVSISLPDDMEQVFQQLDPAQEDSRSVINRRKSLASNQRTEFFKHAGTQDATSNKEEFDELFVGFENHKVDICILCSARRVQSLSTPSPTAEDVGDLLAAEGSSPPGGGSSMSEDSEIGRKLLRKEVLRLLLQLSCSVGARSTEQGLLILKQRFPKSFQNLCLYSEVSHLLSTCSFRLKARRFVQELFLDLDSRECQRVAQKILDLPESPPSSSNSQRTPSLSTSDDFKSPFTDFDYTYDRNVS